MLNWFKKDKIVKKEVITLNPVTISSVRTHPDGGIEFKITRGIYSETIRMYGGDIFQIHRDISVSLQEK